MNRQSQSGVGTQGAEPASGEVYFEFIQFGQSIKVSAIDADTGTEVSVFGPRTSSQSDLQRVALRKLRRRLEKGQ